MSTFTRYAIALVITLSCPRHVPRKLSPYSSLTTIDKQKHALKVFDDLVQAFQRPKKQPSFSLAPLGHETGSIAVTKLNKGGASIELDEKAYDLLYAPGGAGDDALAAILGHELAHYYLDHNWAGDFLHRQDTLLTNAFWSLMQRQQVSDNQGQGRVREETQADVEGGMASYLAGFNSLSVMGPTLKLLYKSYGIPENGRGYPPLSERIVIASQSAMEVDELIKVFETGNRLLLIGKYDEAASCFDFMTRDLNYPTPELYNNAGVARATEAIHLIDSSINSDSLRYVYPIEFDAETSLAHGTRSSGTERGLALSSTDLEKAMIRASLLLDEARKDFEAAIGRDPQYSVAYLDLACVLQICGDSTQADLRAKEALLYASHDNITIANAHIVLGIITAAHGNSGYAKREFEAGMTANPTLATFCLARVTDPYATTEQDVGCSEGEPSGVERIGEFSAFTVWNNNVATSSLDIPENHLEGSDSVTPQLRVLECSGGGWHAYELKKDKDQQIISFLVTSTGFDDSTSNHIRVGSDTTDLRQEYGCPARVWLARQRQFWIYDRSKIIFATNLNGKVTGWTLWREGNI